MRCHQVSNFLDPFSLWETVTAAAVTCSSEPHAKMRGGKVESSGYETSYKYIHLKLATNVLAFSGCQDEVLLL